MASKTAKVGKAAKVAFRERLSQCRVIEVPQVNKESQCPLKLSDRIVYGYLLYSNSQGSIPTNKDICKYTGYHPDTVNRCLDVLERHQLIEDKTILERTDIAQSWFKPCPNQQFGLYTYACFIKAKNSKLSQQDISVLSYVLHCDSTGFKPRITSKHLVWTLGISERGARDSKTSLSGYVKITRHGRGITFNESVWDISPFAIGDNVTVFDSEEFLPEKEKPEITQPQPPKLEQPKENNEEETFTKPLCFVPKNEQWDECVEYLKIMKWNDRSIYDIMTRQPEQKHLKEVDKHGLDCAIHHAKDYIKRFQNAEHHRKQAELEAGVV